MKEKMYIDLRQGKIVSEEVVRREFTFYINEPWFKQSFEKFCSENFVVAGEDDVQIAKEEKAGSPAA